MGLRCGWIVILNGPPRSGKSSIAHAVQARIPGLWMNVGVDAYIPMTPPQYRPGIGLRPEAGRADLEPWVALMYQALFESVATHSRLGLNVVVDAGIHDAYQTPLHILEMCARTFVGLPALVVGVRCPIDVIMQRRMDTWRDAYAQDGSVPARVRLWQEAVHIPGIYDLEVDTGSASAAACADSISHRLLNEKPPSALTRILERAGTVEQPPDPPEFA